MFVYSVLSARLAKKVGALALVTVDTAGALAEATTVPVEALTAAMPIGTVLEFGTPTKTATLTAAADAEDEELTVEALPEALVAGDEAYSGYAARVTGLEVQMFGGNTRVRSAEGFANDRLAVVASSKIGGSGTMRLLGLDIDAMAVILGEEIIVTGSGATQVRTLSVSTGRLPHFGIIGQAEQQQGVDSDETAEGDALIFMPNIVPTSDIPTGNFEDGALLTVEFTYTGVTSTPFNILNVIERATGGAYTLPPVGIVEAA
jgi:hypothetical protein